MAQSLKSALPSSHPSTPSQVNNNCSTGSTALILAKQLVEGRMADCVLALGFEKMERGSLMAKVRKKERERESVFVCVVCVCPCVCMLVCVCVYMCVICVYYKCN